MTSPREGAARRRVVELEKACYVIPACWHGKLEGGQALHVHVRGGGLTFEIGGEMILEMQFEDEYRGWMDTKEMLRLTGLDYSGNPHRIDAAAWDEMFGPCEGTDA